MTLAVREAHTHKEEPCVGMAVLLSRPCRLAHGSHTDMHKRLPSPSCVLDRRHGTQAARSSCWIPAHFQNCGLSCPRSPSARLSMESRWAPLLNFTMGFAAITKHAWRKAIAAGQSDGVPEILVLKRGRVHLLTGPDSGGAGAGVVSASSRRRCSCWRLASLFGSLGDHAHSVTAHDACRTSGG